jgi:hypothetical protein
MFRAVKLTEARFFTLTANHSLALFRSTLVPSCSQKFGVSRFCTLSTLFEWHFDGSAEPEWPPNSSIQRPERPYFAENWGFATLGPQGDAAWKAAA